MGEMESESDLILQNCLPIQETELASALTFLLTLEMALGNVLISQLILVMVLGNALGTCWVTLSASEVCGVRPLVVLLASEVCGVRPLVVLLASGTAVSTIAESENAMVTVLVNSLMQMTKRSATATGSTTVSESWANPVVNMFIKRKL